MFPELSVMVTTVKSLTLSKVSQSSRRRSPIVHQFDNVPAYLVEFADNDGDTWGIVTYARSEMKLLVRRVSGGSV
jgi:hypothetical protein